MNDAERIQNLEATVAAQAEQIASHERLFKRLRSDDGIVTGNRLRKELVRHETQKRISRVA